MRQWVNALRSFGSFGSLKPLIEFVGLVELIKFVRTSLTDKLWMSVGFQKVFIG